MKTTKEIVDNCYPGGYIHLIQVFIKQHGFTSFVNGMQESVSVWVPDQWGNDELFTVESMTEAKQALGY